MKRLFVLFAVMFVIGVSERASAGGLVTTTVARVGLIQSIGDLLFVQVAAPVNSPPACSANSGWQFVVALNTPQGQQVLALLLAAKSLQNQVSFGGTGACDLYSNVETLDYVEF